MLIVKFSKWIVAMANLFNVIKNLTVAPQPMDDNALRRKVSELEAENQELREKLAWRGPWMF